MKKYIPLPKIKFAIRWGNRNFNAVHLGIGAATRSGFHIGIVIKKICVYIYEVFVPNQYPFLNPISMALAVLLSFAIAACIMHLCTRRYICSQRTNTYILGIWV